MSERGAVARGAGRLNQNALWANRGAGSQCSTVVRHVDLDYARQETASFFWESVNFSSQTPCQNICVLRWECDLAKPIPPPKDNRWKLEHAPGRCCYFLSATGTREMAATNISDITISDSNNWEIEFTCSSLSPPFA